MSQNKAMQLIAALELLLYETRASIPRNVRTEALNIAIANGDVILLEVKGKPPTQKYKSDR